MTDAVTDAPGDAVAGRPPVPVAAEPALDLFTHAVRDLGPDPTVPDLMRAAVAAAVTGLPGTDAATITGPTATTRLRTLAATGPLPVVVEQLQSEHGGPAVDTVHGGQSAVHSDDLGAERRWPALAAAVAATGVRSMASYRLAVVTTAESIGSLNLYATGPGALDPATVAAGARLAAYAAAVIGYHRERELVRNLHQALDSNRDIGVAVGILMTRRMLTRDAALELLKQRSQLQSRKLREIAHDVVYTGDLPPAPPSATR